MIIFQLTLQVTLLENLPSECANGVICKFIDNLVCQKEELIEFHNAKDYKLYCFNSLYPICKDKIYKKGNSYKLQIRTVYPELAEHFSNSADKLEDRAFKVKKVDVQLLPKNNIAKLYSITPAILKTEYGYWKEHLSLEEYALAIKTNLIKKYNALKKIEMNESFQLFEKIELMNRKPITCAYKNVNLLGDKMDLYISDNEMAQELAYFALGVGILEGNARGFGFVNDKWRKHQE